MTRQRSILAVAALSLGFLTACGTSPPPARELALEMIDTLEDANGDPVSEDVKACMRDEVDSFRLSDEDAQGFEDLDDVASKAAEGQERAIQIMLDFQNALASCN